MDPLPEANREAPAAAPGGDGVSLVKLGLLFYGTLFAVALVWSVWSGRSVFYASQAAAERGVAPLLDIGLGLVVAVATIALSRKITESTRIGAMRWGARSPNCSVSDRFAIACCWPSRVVWPKRPSSGAPCSPRWDGCWRV